MYPAAYEIYKSLLNLHKFTDRAGVDFVKTTQNNR